MRIAILCFALGVWLLQRQAALPAGDAPALLAAVLAGLTFTAWRLRGPCRQRGLPLQQPDAEGEAQDGDPHG
ncbi:MAG: hypothetical protein K8F56_10300, partial [Rhodocyclaceae bacterium]|nr:hypothetical protein [Rhodocyclaceae bacterium]